MGSNKMKPVKWAEWVDTGNYQTYHDNMYMYCLDTRDVLLIPFYRLSNEYGGRNLDQEWDPILQRAVRYE